MSKRVLVVAGITAGVALLVGLTLFAGIGIVRAAGHAVAENQVQRLLRTNGAMLQAPITPTEKGLVVVIVVPGGAADKAGVKRGDVLLQVDGKDVNQLSDYRNVLSSHKPNDQVKLALTHGDEQRTLTATLTDSNGRADLGLFPFGGMQGRGRGFQFGQPGFPVSTTGAMVADVVTGGPADKAGIKQGDVINSVDGKAIGPNNNLADVVASHKPGDTVPVEVTTPGQAARTLQVQLGDNPDKKGIAYLGLHYMMSPGGFGKRGPFGNNQPGTPFQMNGAVIRNVAANSPAEQAGLKAGDVISVADGKTIDSPQTLSGVITGHKPGDELTLSVKHADGSTADVKVTLGDDPNKKGSAYLGVSIGRGMRIQRPNAGNGQNGGINPFFGGRGGQNNQRPLPSQGNTL